MSEAGTPAACPHGPPRVYSRARVSVLHLFGPYKQAKEGVIQKKALSMLLSDPSVCLMWGLTCPQNVCKRSGLLSARREPSGCLSGIGDLVFLSQESLTSKASLPGI